MLSFGHHHSTVIQSMRPPFLLLTPACILLGYSLAWQEGGAISLGDLLLVLLGGLAAHISVNTLNEYEDFHSGLDALTRKTPFSGGSGALVANPAAAGWVWQATLAALFFTGLIGLYFLVTRGWVLLPLGLTGLALILSYTKWLNRNPLLCLLAPGLGFGPLMTGGSYLALGGNGTLSAWAITLIPMALVSNLLLLNQFPDIDADQKIGRRHFPIVYGTLWSSRLYALLSLCAALILAIALVNGNLPLFALLAALPLTLALPVSIGAHRHGQHIEHLLPYMGMNVIISLLTPSLLAAGILLG